MARPPQSTEFHYGNYVRFIVKLFQFSIVPLPPLPSLAFWTIYSAKDFPFEYTQSSFITSCRSPGFFGKYALLRIRYLFMKNKGKAIPSQAWTGPGGSRSLGLPDFKIIGTWRR